MSRSAAQTAAGSVAAPRPAAGAPTPNATDALPHIEDVLAREGVFVSTSVGVSMWPMLRNRRDTVVVRHIAPGERLRRHDVALYRRGDDYVLHRVIEARPGSYVILGDNCLNKEFVNQDQVIGVLDEFYRSEKHVSLDAPAYRAYVRVWCVLYPARALAKRLRARAARAVKSRLGR